MPKRTFVYIDGKEVETTDPSKLSKKQKAWCVDKGYKLVGVSGIRLQSTYPMTSDRSGVNPDQREQAIQTSIDMGIPTDFDHEGDAVFRSKGHRRDYVRAVGLLDRNGGYSDP